MSPQETFSHPSSIPAFQLIRQDRRIKKSSSLSERFPTGPSVPGGPACSLYNQELSVYLGYYSKGDCLNPWVMVSRQLYAGSVLS